MKPETVELVLKILTDRANYWNRMRRHDTSMAYDTAVTLLLYAMNDDLEALRQFDYYGEEN